MNIERELIEMSGDYCRVEILFKIDEFSSSIFLFVSCIESLNSLRRNIKSCDNCDIMSVEAEVSESPFVRSILSLGEELCLVSHSFSIRGVSQTFELLSP